MLVYALKLAGVGIGVTLLCILVGLAIMFRLGEGKWGLLPSTKKRLLCKGDLDHSGPPKGHGTTLGEHSHSHSHSHSHDHSHSHSHDHTHDKDDDGPFDYSQHPHGHSHEPPPILSTSDPERGLIADKLNSLHGYIYAAFITTYLKVLLILGPYLPKSFMMKMAGERASLFVKRLCSACLVCAVATLCALLFRERRIAGHVFCLSACRKFTQGLRFENVSCFAHLLTRVKSGAFGKSMRCQSKT